MLFSAAPATVLGGLEGPSMAGCRTKGINATSTMPNSSFDPPNPASLQWAIGKFYSNVGRGTSFTLTGLTRIAMSRRTNKLTLTTRRWWIFCSAPTFAGYCRNTKIGAAMGSIVFSGEPIRIRLQKSMDNTNHRWTREYVTECLWSNFEAPVLESVVSEGIKRMPKIDTADLLQSLMKERDDIDAAIRALNRTLARNFAPTTSSRRTKAQPTKASGNGSKRKGHKWSEAERKAMSAKLKASWATRKKGNK